MADARPLVVVVGSGFGGLTLARELAKAPVRVLVVDRNNYHLFTPLLYQVATVLLEGMDRLLSTFHPDLSEAAHRALTRKGVEVHLGALVDEVQAESIRLHDGRTLEAGTVVWTAGVRAG